METFPMNTGPVTTLPDPVAPEYPPDASLQDKVVLALQTVYDPEIPVNIHELGLIYAINIDDDAVARIDMTLTAPACPVAGTLPEQVRRVVEAVPGISGASVELVWDPPWGPERMSEAAQLELGLL